MDARRVLEVFPEWSDDQQRELVRRLMFQLKHQDLVAVTTAVNPILRRDFIGLLPNEIAEKILSFLEPQSLRNAELVCTSWRRILLGNDATLWRRVMDDRVARDATWRTMEQRYREPIEASAAPEAAAGERVCGYKRLYKRMCSLNQQLASNWVTGQCRKRSIESESNGIYCLQFDEEKIISGSRDNTLKVWDINSLHMGRQFVGHSGSVLCLQFDDRKVISGSSDTTVCVWNLATGEVQVRLEEHTQSVLHLKFDEHRLVTCSKDKTVIVWRIISDTEYEVEHKLEGHRAAVNVVEFDHRFIVSASGDRSIRIWETETGAFVRRLLGHERGIACLQYTGDFIVSGSSDEKLKVWKVSSAKCIRTLFGHRGLVRCVRFDSQRIVSGSYDNSVRVWDFNTGEFLFELLGHDNRVFRVQFDGFKIISSSQDDRIRIWDFGPRVDGEVSAFPNVVLDADDDGVDEGNLALMGGGVSP